MSTSRGISPENGGSAAASGARSHRSSLASIDTQGATNMMRSPTTSNPPTALDQDIIAAASAATGVDLVAAQQQQQQDGQSQPTTAGRRTRTTTAGSARNTGRSSARASSRQGASAGNRPRSAAGDTSATAAASPGADDPSGAAGGDFGSGIPAAPQQPALPGYEKRAARKPTVGMRLAAARVSASVNQHEVAARCGIPVNKVFSIEKGAEDDLEKWAPILAHVAIALGVPFSELFGDYLSCTQNPHVVDSASIGGGSKNFSSSISSGALAASSSEAILSSTTSGAGGLGSTQTIASPVRGSGLPAAPPPYKLTVGGRVRHCRERLKVASELIADVLVDQGVLADKEEYDNLEMCDTGAEDVMPILLYVVYRSGVSLASIVL